MKKTLLIILIIIVLVVITLFIYSGFRKRNDAVINNYLVSDDRKTMKLSVEVASSIGYVRDIDVVYIGNRMYISFYSTFGLNSSIGAKSEFEINLDEMCTTDIYLLRENSEYRLVLTKDKSTEMWEKVY